MKWLPLLACSLPALCASKPDVSRIPMAFTQGAPDSGVRFSAQAEGHGVFLTDREAILAVGKENLAVAVRGGRAVRPQGQAPLPGTANFLVGSDRSQWRTNVPTYGRVSYSGVLPGVDLIYYGHGKQLEYDIEVAPGTDPSRIQLEISRGWKLKKNKKGDLELRGARGSIQFDKPVAYQLAANGDREPVAAEFTVASGQRFGFKLGAYDRSRKLTIDPVLQYGTYLGGLNPEYGYGLAVDSSGNAYVTGYTFSVDFPLGASPIVGSCTGNGSLACGEQSLGRAYAFVTKFNSTGTAILYSTYLGGIVGNTPPGFPAFTTFEGAVAQGIAVDAGGNAYIAGWTRSSDFPDHGRAVRGV
jgi:hypothetical protein